MSYIQRSNVALTALALLIGTSAASAAVVGPFAGNECGEGGFSACTLTIDNNVTPAVLKFNSNFEVSDSSTLFPTITGDEFSFFGIVTNQGDVEGASFRYTLGAGDPGITGFAVFSAGEYLVYDSNEITFADRVYTGSFTTLGLGDNPNNPTPGLSHITFFDTAAPNNGGGLGNGGGTPAPIPLPAGGLLMLTGLAGLAAARRKRS